MRTDILLNVQALSNMQDAVSTLADEWEHGRSSESSESLMPSAMMQGSQYRSSERQDLAAIEKRRKDLADLEKGLDSIECGFQVEH
jgi:hypothetical protein